MTGNKGDVNISNEINKKKVWPRMNEKQRTIRQNKTIIIQLPNERRPRDCEAFSRCYRSSLTVMRSRKAAWAAARRAMGTRNGEQLT